MNYINLAKYFVVVWSVLNILFLPVAGFSSVTEITELTKTKSSEEVFSGGFGRITPINLFDGFKENQERGVGERCLKNTGLSFNNILLLLIFYYLFLAVLGVSFFKYRKSQASVEYLMIIGLVLIVVIPLFYYAFSQSNINVKINQADDAVNTLAKAADTVYALGPGSKKYVWITIPNGGVGSAVTNNTIMLQLSVFGGISDFHTSTKPNLIGAFPYQAGNYKIPVEALDSGFVLIGEGNDTTPPEVTWKSPSGNICYQNVVLEAYTNEPAHCRWESSDVDYDSMSYDFQGEILTHTYSLPILDEGDYTYYVRCMDPFENKMTSSAVISFTINISICGTGNGTGEGCIGVYDTNPPIVTPVNPPDNYTSNASRNYFYFNVSDESEVGFCELIIDGLPKKTEAVISKESTNSIWYDLGMGNYGWSVNCTDACPNEGGFSPARNISVNATLDNDPPIVNLSIPVNGSILEYNIINFFYVVEDAISGIYSCTLNVSGQLDTGGNTTRYITDVTVQEGVSQYMTMALDRGNYTWIVSCRDDSFYQNEGISQEWQFRINKTMEAGIALTDLGVDYGWYFKTNGNGIYTPDSQMVSLVEITQDLIDDVLTTPSTSYVIRTRPGDKYEGFIVKVDEDSSQYIKVTLYGRVRIIDTNPYNLRVYSYLDDDTPNTNIGGYLDFAIPDTVLNEKVKWFEIDVSELAASEAGKGWMKFRVTDLEQNNKRLLFSELHIKVG